MEEVIKLYSTGIVCGVLLSFIPYVVSSVIYLALKIMRKGGS